MQIGECRVGNSGTIRRDQRIILSVDEKERKIFDIRQSSFDLFVTLACAHQRYNGSEALRPQGGEIERSRTSVTEAGQVNAVAIDVVTLQNVLENGVKAAGSPGRPPISGGLRVEDEVVSFGDLVFGGGHAVDGIACA